MTVMAAFHNAIAVYINSSSADYLLKLVLCSYRIRIPHVFFFFFFNDRPPTEIYPLSLHDPLPIYTNAFFFTRGTTVNGAFVYGAVATRHLPHTPGAGYLEGAEVPQGSGGKPAGVAVDFGPLQIA